MPDSVQLHTLRFPAARFIVRMSSEVWNEKAERLTAASAMKASGDWSLFDATDFRRRARKKRPIGAGLLVRRHLPNVAQSRVFARVQLVLNKTSIADRITVPSYPYAI
jgi:hypothetical protein